MNDKVLAEKVLEVSGSLGIKLDRDPYDFFQKRTKLLFTSPATNKVGQKVVFRISFSSLFNESIKREAEIYVKSLKLKLNFFPDLINSGDSDGNKWLIYKYIDGNTAGNTYFFQPDTDYRLIIDFLAGMQQLGSHLPKELFRVSSKEKYLKLISVISAKNDSLTKKLVQQIGKIIASAKEWKENSFVHGDFHPQNIFINDQGIKIIDWESAHYNLTPFDYSFVWIRSYNTKVRDEILDILEKNGVDDDQINFVFSVNILRDLFEWHQIELGKNEFVKKDNNITESVIKSKIEDLEKNLEYFVSKL